MIRRIERIIKSVFERKQKPKNKDRENLEKKVLEGTNKAINEYRDVFEKLAEYDRS